MYESELERIGNVYMLQSEPPHRLHTVTAETIMGTGIYGFRCGLLAAHHGSCSVTVAQHLDVLIMSMH